jgi:hypothetical protein
MTIKLHFDGEKIDVPDELRGRGPLELTAEIVDVPPTSSDTGGSDLSEFFGSIKMTEAEVREWLADIRRGRDDGADDHDGDDASRH